jgi:hypothetical protein
MDAAATKSWRAHINQTTFGSASETMNRIGLVHARRPKHASKLEGVKRRGHHSQASCEIKADAAVRTTINRLQGRPKAGLPDDLVQLGQG